MNLSQYRSDVRVLSGAYAVARRNAATAEHTQKRELLALAEMIRKTPDRLRVQVCTSCNARGLLPPNSEGVQRTCRHPEVPHLVVEE